MSFIKEIFKLYVPLLIIFLHIREYQNRIIGNIIIRHRIYTQIYNNRHAFDKITTSSFIVFVPQHPHFGLTKGREREGGGEGIEAKFKQDEY